MSAVGRFLRWWTRELGALVPPRVARALAPRRDSLAAFADGADPPLTLIAGGRSMALGPLSTVDAATRRRFARAAAAGRLSVVLVVPPARVVTRRVRLPLAAEQSLDAVLGFEMDRLTPFAADEVLHARTLVARSAERGEIALDMTFAPKAVLAPTVAALGEAGLHPDRAALGAADGPAMRGLAGRRRAAPLAARAAQNAAALLVALGAAWAGLSLRALDREAAVLETAAAALRAEALAAEASRREAAGDAAALAFALKTQRPMAGAALAELSALLPDAVWLTDLRLADDRIEISGFAPDATSLIRLLDAAPGFDAPRFLAPVTRETGRDRERFALEARIAPGAAPWRESALRGAPFGSP